MEAIRTARILQVSSPSISGHVLRPAGFLAALTVVSLLGFPAAMAQEPPAYVGTQSCTACHQEQVESWQDSHHALAWTPAEDRNIVADFDGTTFQGTGMAVAFSQDEKGFHADVTEKTGETTRHDVHSVVGIAPLQQFLFETEPGRLQSFDIVWDDEKKTWYHLYPDARMPPSDGLHWTGAYKNWNGRCAECHATGFEKNYNSRTRSFQSVQAEIGVGCEACHGPGAAHLEWAENRQPIEVPGLDIYGFTMAGDADNEAWIQQCASCHSRREAFEDGNPLPGTPYHDAYRLALLTPDLYYPDGQIMEEVYVYGSFLQSKMYAEGVGCTNCHDPHAARLLAEGNAVCTQCHSPAGNPEFSGLPLKEFDSESHHFHPEGSSGAQCRNCHMVETTYMGIDDRADHSFRIPRPDLAAQTGAPDACTTCHSDQSAAWAAEKIETWYPDSDKRGPHFGTSFAHALSDPMGARGSLLTIANDQDQADIVRATALYLMQNGADAETAAQSLPLLSDDSPLVRAAAVRLQRSATPMDRVQNLIGMLADPVRLVRISTAPELLNAPIARLPDQMAANMQAVMQDWQQQLANRADFPETHLVLAGTALTMRNFDLALNAFGEATRLDPQMVDAWVMIARIESAMEDRDGALQTLEKALAANPGDPNLTQIQQDILSQ